MTEGSLNVCHCMPQALGPAVDNAADWDVLVAHGLGIDHAGHTHDVGSPQMLAKLRETDAHVKQARISVKCLRY